MASGGRADLTTDVVEVALGAWEAGDSVVAADNDHGVFEFTGGFESFDDEPSA